MGFRVIKITVICIFIIGLFYLASYKPDRISIEGRWTPDKIILNNKTVFPRFIDSLIKDFRLNQIHVNNWNNTFYILFDDNLNAQFSIRKEALNKKIITFKSETEKSLNGDFDITIDTTFFDKMNYEIVVEIKSDSSYIKFHRTVQLKPWELPAKPPPRGTP